MDKAKKRSACPISSTLDIFGDKWSLLIIRDLIRDKTCTYGDFLKAEEKIATNILATRLKLLEEHGIILKGEHPGSKAKVLYRLSPKGIDLLPLMAEINLWADKYFDLPADAKATVAQLKLGKEALLAARAQELAQ